jgi:hypothetical protein
VFVLSWPKVTGDPEKTAAVGPWWQPDIPITLAKLGAGGLTGIYAGRAKCMVTAALGRNFGCVQGALEDPTNSKFKRHRTHDRLISSPTGLID